MMRITSSMAVALLLLFTTQAQAKTVPVPADDECHAKCKSDVATGFAACMSGYNTCTTTFLGYDPYGICADAQASCDDDVNDKAMLCEKRCDFGIPF